jgi:hypothetical protein
MSVTEERYDPYEWQQSDVDYVLDSGGLGFIVADPGAGKTIEATEIGEQGDFGTRLVIAPKGTHERVWRKDIMRQYPDAIVRAIDGSEAGKDAMNALEWGEPGWYLMSPQIMTRWKVGDAALRPDLAIVDEAHQVATRGSKSLEQLLKVKAGHRIVMSGTMVRNKVENFWGLLRWVYPMLDGPTELADVNYERWVTEYMRIESDRFDPKGYKIVGEKKSGRIASEIPCYVQHFKRAECCWWHPEGFLANLPAPVEIDRVVELLPEQKSVMQRMEKDYIVWLEDRSVEERGGARRPIVAKLPLVARTRLRQMTLAVPTIVGEHINDEGNLVVDLDFAPDAKSPKFDDMVEVWNQVQEPLVAATTSQKFARYAVNRLNRMGIRAFEWSGAVTQKRRDEALQMFEAGGYDIVVGVTSAVGTGIDGLQLASGVLYSLETDDDLTNEIQLESRLDRRGQKRETGVLHYRAMAEGSLDFGIVSNQLRRRLALNASLQKQQRKAARQAA